MKRQGLLLAVALCSTALALPKYRLQAIQTVHYDRDNPLWQLDRRVMPCSYCHVSERGGAPWNPFGNALREQFRQDAAAGTHRNLPQTLVALLEQQKDADGDGYSDVLEVFARTLPGDAASHPTSSVTEVEETFKAAGGMKLYQVSKTKK